MTKLILLFIFLWLAILIGAFTSCTKQDYVVVSNQISERQTDRIPKAILHVIALNEGAKDTLHHPFIIVLHAMDATDSARIVNQLIYMNQQGSYGALYPSPTYPNDTLIINGQGFCWELQVSETQDQIDNGSKLWIQRVCTNGYGAIQKGVNGKLLITENTEGRKMIFVNK